MRFLFGFITAFSLSCAIFFISASKLIGSPISAEYWVRELIFVKKELAKKYQNDKKIIVAGGSNTLFNIDAEYATKAIGTPILNFGLHAGLPLEKILSETQEIVNNGDILILPLEAVYYECNDKLSEWQVRMIIAWDNDAWKEMDFKKRLDFVSLISPSLFGEMVTAKVLNILKAPIALARIEAFDDKKIMAKFADRDIGVDFGYSAYKLNNYGDMQNAEGARYQGRGYDDTKPNHICNSIGKELKSFVNQMAERNVKVYFSNTPYIKSDTDLNNLRLSENAFLKEISQIGCVIENREELVFDRKYFFNSNLHLNKEGRRLRTELFINAIRNRVFTEKCDNIFTN